MTFDKLRRDYERDTLLEEAMEQSPFDQFRRWFDEARAADIYLPDAMALCTADRGDRPNVRMVVLRGFDEQGVVFYTNYGSDKAKELDANPYAALHFHWNVLERQVKITGAVERTAREGAEEYWARRPRSSQVGAWASAQGSVLEGRGDLDRAAADIEDRYNGKPIPCPPDWGGFRLAPDSFEFWQGRPSRLHDRLRYMPGPDGWVLERLAP